MRVTVPTLALDLESSSMCCNLPLVEWLLSQWGILKHFPQSICIFISHWWREKWQSSIIIWLKWLIFIAFSRQLMVSLYRLWTYSTDSKGPTTILDLDTFWPKCLAPLFLGRWPTMERIVILNQSPPQFKKVGVDRHSITPLKRHALNGWQYKTNFDDVNG